MIPVTSSPTRSLYSSNIMPRSASRIRWRITCLAVWAAIRPKSSGVTSRVLIWSMKGSRRSGSSSSSSGSRRSPVSGSIDGPAVWISGTGSPAASAASAT